MQECIYPSFFAWIWGGWSVPPVVPPVRLTACNNLILTPVTMRQMGGGLRHVTLLFALHNKSLACMFKQRMSDMQQLKMQYDRRSPQSHIAACRKRSTLAKMPNTFQIFFGGYLDSPNFLQEVMEAAGRVRKVVNG